jgi:hypothetical protein
VRAGPAGRDAVWPAPRGSLGRVRGVPARWRPGGLRVACQRGRKAPRRSHAGGRRHFATLVADRRAAVFSAMSAEAPKGKMPGLSRAVTGGVPPLRLRSTCGLPRRRRLPFLLANQTALTPSAQPPGKPGLHSSHLPLLSWTSHSDPGWPTPLHRLPVPRLVMPTAVRARHSRGATRAPAQRRRPHRQRGQAHSVRRFPGRIRGETGAPPTQESGPAACTGHRQPQPGARPSERQDPRP